MNTLFRKSFLLSITCSLVILSACKKQLDINVSPNNPLVENGTPSVVFPAGIFGTAAGVGGEYAILGGIWGQYVTQSAFSNQYKVIDAYQLSSSDMNRPYRLLFANGLKNYQFVIDKSRTAANWNMYLMGTVMKAYTAQVLVDLYDKIPYSEALQGLGNLSPKFDEGYAIYTDLLDSIDVALTRQNGSAAVIPTEKSADLIFHGDMDQWQRFARSLEMKMYLRMVNKKPAEAAAGLNKLKGKDFLESDAALTGFTDVADKDNPMYDYNIRSLNTPDNLRASATFATFLINNEDPRSNYFFGTASPVYVNQGDYTGTDPSYKTATVLAQKAVEPVVFISAAETYFMQAEANERYFGLSGKEFYTQGVAASFASVGEIDTAFTNPGGLYAYPEGGTLDQKIEAISTQKWVSCAYGVHYLEGFFEKNRTGYPRTSPVYSTDPAYIPGQFVISKNTVLAPGILPKRLVYPQAESQSNSNTPSAVPISTPVWWAL